MMTAYCLKKRVVSALLVLCLSCSLLSGCRQELKGVDAAADPVSYDASTLECTVGGLSYANLFEYDASPNQRYLVYVASQLNEDPEAWLYDRETDTHTKLTDNGYYIESEAHVDDNGNWALVLTETSNSTSKILYNGEVVADGNVWNHSLCFLGDDLFFASYAPATKSTALCLYGTESGETTVITSGRLWTTGKSLAVSRDTVLLETYDHNKKYSTVLAVHPAAEKKEQRVEPLTDGTGSSFLRLDDEGVVIEQVTGDANAMYLFNAYYWTKRYQTAEPWSGSTDSAGRISWNESYRLLGELELLEKTGDPALRSHIAATVYRLIATRKAAYLASGRDTDQFLFVTRKYSLDQQAELTMMVDNSMIYWMMLKAANAGCLDETDRAELLSMAEAAYQYYEGDWDSEPGCYHFRKGTPFWADGVVLPFNQQNVFGLCLIELWKATGNESYRDRCTAMAESFAKEIELTEDGLSIWHYWPQAFYAGWTESDGISENTPEYAPAEAPLYEDSFHAALNAAFILGFAEEFGNSVFTEEMIRGVFRTADTLFTDEGCSDRLYPANTDLAYYDGLWAVCLERGKQDIPFARLALRTETFSIVEFDNQSQIYAFARLIDPEQGGSLQVSHKRYDASGCQTEEPQTVVFADIPAYAGTFCLI